MKPRVFISAVTHELKQTRQLGANILTRLGYEPVWQDIFGTEGGDLRQMLRDKIGGCDGLVHVVGRAYGAEPPQPDEEFGRVSYTQFELRYAQKRKKKTWILFVEDGFPTDTPPEQLDLPPDPTHPDPLAYQAERRGLQDAWWQTLRGESHLWHAAATGADFELKVERLKDELGGLRRSFWRWQMTVLLALFVLVGLGVGLWATVFRQRDEQKAEVQQLNETINTQAEQIQAELAKLRPENIKSQLRKTIEETYQKDLKEAEALKDWKKRDDAKNYAAETRDKRLGKVDEFLDSITKTIQAGDASPEFLELTRILADQGAVEALKYIESQKARLLASAKQKK